VLTLKQINDHMTRPKSRLLASDGWGDTSLDISHSNTNTFYTGEVESLFELRVTTRLITPAPYDHRVSKYAAEAIHKHLFHDLEERLLIVRHRMNFCTKDEAMQLLDQLINDIKG